MSENAQGRVGIAFAVASGSAWESRRKVRERKSPRGREVVASAIGRNGRDMSLGLPMSPEMATPGTLADPAARLKAVLRKGIKRLG